MAGNLYLNVFWYSLIIKFNIEPLAWRVWRQWTGWKYAKLYNYRRYGLWQQKGNQRPNNEVRSPAKEWSGWSGCLDGESLEQEVDCSWPHQVLEVLLNTSHPSITRKQVETYEVWKEESWSCLLHSLDQNFVES